jgi:hypothetical protein
MGAQTFKTLATFSAGAPLGPGAGVVASDLDLQKTILVSAAEPFSGVIVIEASADGGVTFQPVASFTIDAPANTQDSLATAARVYLPEPIVIEFVAEQMRANLARFASNVAVTVTVGAEAKCACS